jgi:hypothetical protein
MYEYDIRMLNYDKTSINKHTFEMKLMGTYHNAHKEYCLRAEKHPTENIMATGSSLEDSLLKIWSLDSRKCLASAKTSGEINGI